MAEIHAILLRKEDETPARFKQRCDEFLSFSEFPFSGASRAHATGRATQVGARHIEFDPKWGQNHAGHLPAESCVIASYTTDEKGNGPIEINVTQLRRAPVNPEIFPRLPHRLSLEEFSLAAKLTKETLDHNPDDTSHGESLWVVTLDGCRLGSFGGSEIDAVIKIHKQEVERALSCCSSEDGDMVAASTLPSKDALVPHPEVCRKFRRPAALAKQASEWTPAFTASALDEGWALREVRGELLICREEVEGSLAEDVEVLDIVANGSGDHHLVARTILATKSAFEYCRMLREVSANSRQHIQRERATA